MMSIDPFYPKSRLHTIENMGQAGAVPGNVRGPVHKTNITDGRIALAANLTTETGTEAHPSLVVDLVVGRGVDTIPLAVVHHDDVIPVAHSVELILKRKRQSLILSFEPLLQR